MPGTWPARPACAVAPRPPATPTPAKALPRQAHVIFKRIGADAPATLNALTGSGPREYGAARLVCALAFTESGPELGMTAATAGFTGDKAL